jgi:HSP20 family molecular chaperone IbpA
MIEIPIDIYQSFSEIVVLMPLWWVHRSSISINLKEYTLIIQWERKQPNLREDLLPLEQSCYRWIFEKKISLPPNVYFDRIQSKLNTENILTIIIPKVIIPEQIPITIE